MIFIIGGAFQGKRDFAIRMAADLERKECPGFLLMEKEQEMNRREQEPKEEGLKFADGGKVSWEVFRKARYAENLHLMIRRRLEEGEKAGELEEIMAGELMEGCPDRILITDEIGYGIVPADAFERQYRELAGRIGCKVAAESEEVWRVTAGIGQRIK